ncbi:MAG TPA: SPASM domain-containing protein [Anaerolineae bacterium]|nr:SPASM domain-containing protein [Anaerolineae bacterium]
MKLKDILWPRLRQGEKQAETGWPVGLHHYMVANDGAYTRFHLRVEADGQGLLLANAAAAARLAPTGTLIAKYLLEGLGENDVLGKLQSRFQGGVAEMLGDIKRVEEIIKRLSEPGDNYPILNLDDGALTADASQLIAPFEATVPLGEPAVMRPLLDRLWAVGIPHVTFLAPVEANGIHLYQAIERAEDLGMIAGVRGRATDLWQGRLLADLAAVGVDHVTVPYVSLVEAEHDRYLGEGDWERATAVLRDMIRLEVCPVAEIPLLLSNEFELEAIITGLQAEGTYNFSIYGLVTEGDSEEILTAGGMAQAATLLEDAAARQEARYIWQPPVERDERLSLEAQIGAGPRCAGDVAVRVELDGRVIPARGPAVSVGNILTDDWDKIWGAEAFKRYRERVTGPTRCGDCPGLAICAADCPRERAGWAQGGGV